jgi:hypothetical protein
MCLRWIRSSAAVAVACLSVLAGCAAQMKQQEQAAQSMPVNCATAEGDLRMLQAEKANAAQQLALGVTAIVPIGLVAGLLTHTEGTKLQVATGEYNQALDQKIVQIQTQCGLL